MWIDRDPHLSSDPHLSFDPNLPPDQHWAPWTGPAAIPSSVRSVG
jgi:hypothetical protein